MNKPQIKYVIFDLGGVLIDWNPEYLYKKVFNGEPEKMEWFLQTVCTKEWNMEQDAGRTFEEGTLNLLKTFPEYESEIRVFFDRWEEMLAGEIEDTALILNKLNSLSEVKLYALTNWSTETFPIAKKRFEFLKCFEGIVVSGEEHCRKPFPKIYEITLNRFGLEPQHCIFIDDSLENVEGARKMGIIGLHYKNSKQLKADLQRYNIYPK